MICRRHFITTTTIYFFLQKYIHPCTTCSEIPSNASSILITFLSPNFQHKESLDNVPFCLLERLLSSKPWVASTVPTGIVYIIFCQFSPLFSPIPLYFPLPPSLFQILGRGEGHVTCQGYFKRWGGEAEGGITSPLHTPPPP